MYIHLLLASSPVLFCGNVLLRFTSSYVCCNSFRSIQDFKWHFAKGRSEFIAIHFTKKTSPAESATTMETCK